MVPGEGVGARPRRRQCAELRALSVGHLLERRRRPGLPDPTGLDLHDHELAAVERDDVELAAHAPHALVASEDRPAAPGELAGDELLAERAGALSGGGHALTVGGRT